MCVRRPVPVYLLFNSSQHWRFAFLSTKNYSGPIVPTLYSFNSITLGVCSFIYEYARVCATAFLHMYTDFDAASSWRIHFEISALLSDRIRSNAIDERKKCTCKSRDGMRKQQRECIDNDLDAQIELSFFRNKVNNLFKTTTFDVN